MGSKERVCWLLLLNHLYVRTQRRCLFLLAPFLRSLLPSIPSHSLLVPSFHLLALPVQYSVNGASVVSKCDQRRAEANHSLHAIGLFPTLERASLYDFCMLGR